MPIDSFTILTGNALDVVAQVHDRQPHVLPPALWQAWLEAPVPEALALMEPKPLAVRYRTVGAAVGNVRNDDQRLVEPVPAMEGAPQGAWDFCAGEAGATPVAKPSR
jgi:putative SOS response-associated peptidase YedK